MSAESRKKLAEEFEVAVSTVKRWESGVAKPHPKLKKLIRDFIKKNKLDLAI